MIKQGQGGYRQFSLNQSHQQMLENRARNGVKGALNLPNSAWPTLQQSTQQQHQQPHHGSGMRAVFLGNPGGPKRECAGTGVFLPRRVGTQTESRKKPGKFILHFCVSCDSFVIFCPFVFVFTSV